MSVRFVISDVDGTLVNREKRLTEPTIEAGWAAVQPFLDIWAKGKGKVETYKRGSNGPACAVDLLARDGREWHRIEG